MSGPQEEEYRVAFAAWEKFRKPAATLDDELFYVAGFIAGLELSATPPPSTPDREADARDGWRPIETAPKDGTAMLVFERGKIIHARWGGSFHNAFVHCTGLGFCDHATHWRPLPSPPVAAMSPRHD